MPLVQNLHSALQIWVKLPPGQSRLVSIGRSLLRDHFKGGLRLQAIGRAGILEPRRK
jgi:hypothetical protein